jgi:hypothetical protein
MNESERETLGPILQGMHEVLEGFHKRLEILELKSKWNEGEAAQLKDAVVAITSRLALHAGGDRAALEESLLDASVNELRKEHAAAALLLQAVARSLREGRPESPAE